MTFPEDFNLADFFLFDRLAEGLGDKVALRFGDLGYTYADVAERSTAFSGALRELGVARGQRLYLVLPDTPSFAWSLFGSLAHGAVVTLGNPHAATADLAAVIDYVRAAVVVTVPRVAEALRQELRESPWVRAVLLAREAATGEDDQVEIAVPGGLGGVLAMTLPEALGLGRRSVTPPLPKTKRDDEALWLFTSGSTGRPKAAIHTHRDFAFNTEAYAKGTVGYRRDDVTVSVPRLFFGYATGTNLLFPFAVGATVGLFSEKPTPESLGAAVARYRATVVTNVPTMMGKLLEHGGPLDLSSVRFHLSAGEALPQPLLERFLARFGAEVYDGIGSAEMFHIYATNRPGDVRPGSLGRAVDGYSLRVLPEDAEAPGAEPVPAGEIGVLWVKGDSVALGYFQDRDKSWRTFHGHWCRTGDLFRLDADGYLWFVGRSDTLLKVSGQFVAPLEVEACLATHPAVAEAAVIGAQEDGLTRVKAFVVLRHAVEPAELLAHVKARLAGFKVPRWLVVMDALPRNDREKVDKKLLQDRDDPCE